MSEVAYLGVCETQGGCQLSPIRFGYILLKLEALFQTFSL